MELQQLRQNEPMPRYSSYDLSGRSERTKWYFTKNTWVWVAVVVVALTVLVAFFIGGYYAGVSAGNRFSIPIVSDNITEWDGSCPEAAAICPESYEGIPPVLLVSIDGFRPDYLTRQLTPTLNNLFRCGTNSPYMYPVFPSKTFPNHYSIVTGLYPSYHGIIDNNMYDPKKRKTFKVGVKGFLDPFWWEGEPIWVTAQNQGKHSSIYFWPGSEVKYNDTTYPNDFVKYKASTPYDSRVAKVLEWLDRPIATRPNFLTLYVNEPDKAGHTYGTSSKQVNEALVRVDEMISKLILGLQQRNLLNCINIIIVSDHGMSDTSCNRMLVLQDFMNASDVYPVVGAFGRLRMKNASLTDEAIYNLQCQSDHMRVYPKAQLPVRFHYANSPRVEPIYIDLDAGWSFLNWRPKPNGCLLGNHGYDNLFPDMNAFFMAYGPSFKSNKTVQPFVNIELYELMCELLNITASPNNGTRGSLHHLLRNPMKLADKEKPVSAIIATVPTTEDDYNLRMNSVNCTCAENTTQHDVDNTTALKIKHAPFGIPYSEINTVFYKSLVLLYNKDYLGGFDIKYRLPLWASYTLSSTVHVKDLSPCWRADVRIRPGESSACSYYTDPRVINATIFQRPLFLHTFANISNMEETSVITNSVPKHENYMILIEMQFVEKIKTWVRVKKSINVVSGPAFDFNADGVLPPIGTIMKNQDKYGSLIVPTHYFHIITWCQNKDIPVNECQAEDLDVESFLLPNFPIIYNCESSEDLIKKNAARVADIELLTGITFFNDLPDYEAIRLRTKV